MFLLFAVIPLIAQNISLFKNIGIKEGMSNEFVVDLAIDSQGFVWAATESGLNRISGNRCVAFKTNNSGIARDELAGLNYDKETNSIWIYSKNGEIIIFDCFRQKFSSLVFKDKDEIQKAADIITATDGGLWIAHINGTIRHYNPQTKESEVISRESFPQIKNGIRCIFDDGNGHLYIGLRIDGMIVYDIRSRKSTFFAHDENNLESLPGNNVRSFCIDHMGNIWVGTNGGLGLFNPHSGRFRVFKHKKNDPYSLAGDNVHEIKELSNKHLWIASDIGGISILNLNEYTAKNGDIQFHCLNSENSELSSNNARKIVQDTYGNIWIGNYSTGIDFIPNSPSHFHTLAQNGIPLLNCTGMHTDKGGNLWLGRDNYISKYNGVKIVNSWSFASQLSISSATVYAFSEDEQGYLWIGLGDEGVLKFDTKKETLSRVECAEHLDIHALYGDGEGTMWIGSENGLFSCKQGIAHEETEINKIMGGHPVIFALAEDSHENLWIGTMGNGIFVFDKHRKMTGHFVEGKHLKSNSINQIIRDSNDDMWIATYKGLACAHIMKESWDFYTYDESNGLKDSHIRSIVQDHYGNIWVSMFSGIACFDIHKQKFYNYDNASGIPTCNFVEGASAITPEGDVFFGSPGGICYFKPQPLGKEDRISPVQIIACERLTSQQDKTIYTIVSPDSNGNISLDYDENTFKFSFTVEDFSQEGNVEYSYMMKGLDEKWYDTEGDNEVTFRRLKPGKYVFKIRAKLKNQDWEDATERELRVTIHPPFWLSWWAKLLYAILFGIACWVYVRSYKRKLQLRNSLELERRNHLQKQELNEERLRFFTNITHELRTPLTLIIGPLEDLSRDSRLPAALYKKVDGIKAGAERLLSLVNDLLEFRKAETQNRRLTVAKGGLGSLITEIGMRYKDLNQNPKVEIEVSVSNDLPTLYYDSEVVNTIVNNLMSNAVKYTPEGRISLKAVKNELDDIDISVSDTGYGINEEALPHIFDRYYQAEGKHQASGTGIGLALAKSLAELHEASLSVESREGEGSRFTFTLKADNTYPHALHKEDASDEVSRMKVKPSGFASGEDTDPRPLLLVVEDNVDIRQYIRDSLGEDYRIIQAADGFEGLGMALEQIPDVIVSDIMMPVIDGISMTKRLKEDVRTSHIPIILLTAKTAPSDQEEGYDSGADSYLTKPFSARLLDSRIRNLLSCRRKLVELIVSQSGISREKTVQEDHHEEKPTLSPLDQEFLRKLNSLIEDNLAKEDIDIAFMTDRMAMSHSTLYRKVKALMGMTINEYVRKLKLQHSKQLLLSGDCNVNEAAMMTGFNNMGHFRESFKKEFGILPSDIVKKR